MKAYKNRKTVNEMGIAYIGNGKWSCNNIYSTKYDKRSDEMNLMEIEMRNTN